MPPTRWPVELNNLNLHDELRKLAALGKSLQNFLAVLVIPIFPELGSRLCGTSLKRALHVLL
jgi:hypothetical protein